MHKLIDLLFLAAVTLLLVIDYFPGLLPFIIRSGTIIIVFVLLIVCSFILNRNQNETIQLKDTYKLQVFSIVYMIAAVSILTFMGGESNAAISLFNPFFWIAVIMTLFGAYTTRKKIKDIERDTIHKQ